MKLAKHGIFFMLVIFLNGCIVWSSSSVAVNTLVKEDKGPKIVTFMNNTPYLADFSVALAEHGFAVKPMPTQEQIIEFQRAKDKISVYNQAAARFGLTLQARQTGICAFTEYGIYNFTLMVTDISSNQIVLVLKQKGSDGPCTTVQPVWGTLARALSDNW